jgi:hypothetical protein
VLRLPLLPLPAALLEDKLHELFAPKGERIVKANVNAFRKGQAALRLCHCAYAARHCQRCGGDV